MPRSRPSPRRCWCDLAITCPGYDGGGCWCTFYEDHPELPKQGRFKCGVCHSFVTGGHIQFLGDSAHVLAGQMVDLPEWPEGDE